MRYRLIAQHTDQHAVVLGAGLAGLLTARVLAEHFLRVTVLAESALPDESSSPENIWQAIPSHLLSVQGQRNLERLFPGLSTELLAAGAPVIEWTANAPVRLPDGWAPRFHSDLITRSASPNLLAHLIRRRVLEYGRGSVTFRGGQPISGVEPGGVRLGDTLIEADLVVDTLGRRSPMVGWVAQLGYDAPEQTAVSASVGIAARLYRQPQTVDPGWQALLVVPHGDQRGGILVPVEEGGWLVMLIGCDGDYPPDDEAGFADFAPVPLRDALRQAEPRTPIYTTHDTANRWWHIERLTRWPDHFLTTSAAVYNPAYGLDLTAATLAALALRETLDDQRKRSPAGSLEGLGLRFQKRLAGVHEAPWRMVTAIDGAWSAVAPDHLGRFARWFGRHLLAAARVDARIYQTLLETAGLVTPAYTLLNPAFARQVMRHSQSGMPAAPDTHAPPDFQPRRSREISTQEMAALSNSQE